MTNNDFFSQLKECRQVDILTGLEDKLITTLLKHIRLPDAHVDLLKKSNGISVYGGYYKLFGCYTQSSINMIDWNIYENWAFAWNKKIKDFWFFGETAWGDQYAYLREELGRSVEPRVFFLEGITMNSEIIADNFSSFLEDEFLRNAINPYDSKLVEVRKKIGDINVNEHITYVPSILISGEENVDSVAKLNAVSAMIINGDICTQIVDEPQDGDVKELQTYEDSKGRIRIKVIRL